MRDYTPYDRFKAIQAYHSDVTQLFWAMENYVTRDYVTDADDDYIVQCVRSVLRAYREQCVTHIERED